MNIQVELYAGLIKDVENILIKYGKGSVKASKKAVKEFLIQKENSKNNRIIFTHRTATIDCLNSTFVNGQSIAKKLYVDGHEVTNLIKNLKHLVRTGQIDWIGNSFQLTSKYYGGVNNSSGLYWTNESASKKATLANYLGITETDIES